VRYGNRKAMDQAIQVFAGVVSPADFFSSENVAEIFASAQPAPTPV
jgi:hypothetical protein